MSEQQLWSDEQIIEMLKRAGLNTVPVKAAMCEMRDEYEQRIAALKTEVEWQEHLADESDSQVAGMEIFIGEAKDTWAKFYAQKARITELEAQNNRLQALLDAANMDIAEMAPNSQRAQHIQSNQEVLDALKKMIQAQNDATKQAQLAAKEAKRD